MKQQLVKNLLSKYASSKLDNIARTACPFYKDDKTNFLAVYAQVHQMLSNYVLLSLKLRKNDVSVRGEVECARGRIDCVVERKFENGSVRRIIVEIKLNSLKLLQAAAYAYREGCSVLVLEASTGRVYEINVRLAEDVLRFAEKLLAVKEILRKRGERIPGDWCKFCSSSCAHKTVSGNPDPLKIVSVAINNIDRAVEELLRKIDEVFEKT